MVDTAELIDVAPHYVAMFTLVFVSLEALRAFVGVDNILVDLGVVMAIVFAYRPLVVRLGVAPASWEDEWS